MFNDSAISASVNPCQNSFFISRCWPSERVVRASSRSSKMGRVVLRDVSHKGLSSLSELGKSDAPFDEREQLHFSVEMKRKANVHSWR